MHKKFEGNKQSKHHVASKQASTLAQLKGNKKNIMQQASKHIIIYFLDEKTCKSRYC
jgi:hypothetical protein